DAGFLQSRAAYLEFDPPYGIATAPQIVKPELLALFLNLGDLVIYAQHEVAATERKRLYRSVLAMDRVLSEAADEVVRPEIDCRQVIVKGPVRPGNDLRQLVRQL